tara:strand:+ start:34 stop:426 length:393 start_codon:yes stop_codon:yes gene_type:complete
MATLIPTLTLSSSDATTDLLSFSVIDNLNVKHPSVGLSKLSVTTTGGDNVILTSHSSNRYLYLKHTGEDTSGSAVTTTLSVEIENNKAFAELAAGEFLFVPIAQTGGSVAVQLEASSGTIVAEYAYWTKA